MKNYKYVKNGLNLLINFAMDNWFNTIYVLVNFEVKWRRRRVQEPKPLSICKSN